MFFNQPTKCKSLAIFLMCEAIFVSSCFAQQRNQLLLQDPHILKIFLQEYLRDQTDGEDKTTRYSVAFFDLDDDNIKEAIVYVTGASWCGSGGCTALVLGEADFNINVISYLTITRLPIRVLQEKSNGWNDISVWSQGGGNLSGNTDVLSFDGTAYSSIPSSTPKQLSEEAIHEIPSLPLKEVGDYLYEEN